MPTAAKKTASARKRATPRPVVEDGVEFERPTPLVELELGPDPKESEKAVLFYLTDDDTGEEIPYYVPVAGQAWMALEYMEVLATVGQERAYAWMFKTLIGDEGYAALRSCRTLSMQDLTNITNACQRLILGEEDRPKPRRPGRSPQDRLRKS